MRNFRLGHFLFILSNQKVITFVGFEVFVLLFVWLDYLQEHAKGSTMFGFRGGPAGIMKGKYVEVTSDFVYPYRNQVLLLMWLLVDRSERK